ncbi:MAG: OsmC family protein [Steroidobacteraceae bacterium]
MEPYPHTYIAEASGAFSGAVTVAAPGLAAISSEAARQFGGPGNAWSPETLLIAALADCYVFTFRAVSAAAMFGWRRLECRAEGLLEKRERLAQFTHITVQAALTLAPGADAARAKRLLRQADRACLIANSLKADRTLEIRIIQAPAAADESHPPAKAPAR